MKKSDYVKWEEGLHEGDEICDDYVKQDGEPWKCFDCWHRKRCIYKKNKDWESFFAMLK